MGDPKMRKGLLFAQRTPFREKEFYFCEKDFYYCKNYLLGLCLILNIIKLKLNVLNLSIYAVEIVFETIFHGNGRIMTYKKEFHYLEKDFVSYLFFSYLLIDLSD